MNLLQAFSLIKEPNYTTQEQSKHLIDLGLPKESADMCYKLHYKDVCSVAYTGFDDCPKGETYYLDEPMLRHTYPAGTYTIENGKRIDLSGVKDKLEETDIPCWSVGRLIEIWYKVNRQQCSVPLSLVITHYSGADTIIEYLEKLHKEGVNFSKLED